MFPACEKRKNAAFAAISVLRQQRSRSGRIFCRSVATTVIVDHSRSRRNPQVSLAAFVASAEAVRH